MLLLNPIGDRTAAAWEFVTDVIDAIVAHDALASSPAPAPALLWLMVVRRQFQQPTIVISTTRTTTRSSSTTINTTTKSMNNKSKCSGFDKSKHNAYLFGDFFVFCLCVCARVSQLVHIPQIE